MEFETVVSVVSVAVAVISAIFAWMAVKTSNRSYKAEIIVQLYEKYHSPSIRKDLRMVWKIYSDVWHAHCEDATKALEYVNKGEPISAEMAVKVLEKLDKASPEYIAIDNISGLWTYIMMLAFNHILSIDELSSFVTPRILGFLYPLDEAKAKKYGYQIHPRFSLRNLYTEWKKKYPESF